MELEVTAAADNERKSNETSVLHLAHTLSTVAAAEQIADPFREWFVPSLPLPAAKPRSSRSTEYGFHKKIKMSSRVMDHGFQVEQS